MTDSHLKCMETRPPQCWKINAKSQKTFQTIFFLKMEEESWVGFCLLLLCLSAKGRKFLGVNKPAAACVDVVNAFRENPTCIQECLWR